MVDQMAWEDGNAYLDGMLETYNALFQYAIGCENFELADDCIGWSKLFGADKKTLNVMTILLLKMEIASIQRGRWAYLKAVPRGRR